MLYSSLDCTFASLGFAFGSNSGVSAVQISIDFYDKLVEEKKKRVLAKQEAPLKWQQKLEAVIEANERKLKRRKRRSVSYDSDSESSQEVKRSKKKSHKKHRKHSDNEKKEKRSKHKPKRRSSS
ncbi:hypothetical protein QVD17_16270 [Tagetes erecta]|uniref:Uncharacterized protein n=1 Tax=Tagetes erecta TaxID=13708 RepID=A0AAD8KR62_TARER|nr:hypothetical protein QVD17_16270 [Tagetes erecta]